MLYSADSNICPMQVCLPCYLITAFLKDDLPSPAALLYCIFLCRDIFLDRTGGHMSHSQRQSRLDEVD